MQTRKIDQTFKDDDLMVLYEMNNIAYIARSMGILLLKMNYTSYYIVLCMIG